MDHICFHVVVSSNEAASRLLANSILLCDIKDYHSMGAEKKNHSKTAQREELLGTERTINSNLYLMSKGTEHGEGKRPRPTSHWFHNEYHQHLSWCGENGTGNTRWVRCDILLYKSNLSLVTGGADPRALSESRLQHPVKHGIQIIRLNPMPCFASTRIIHKWQQIV